MQAIHLVQKYFENNGLETEFANSSRLITKINNQKYLVEANDWKTKPVNLSVIQSFYHFLLSTKELAGGLYITNKGFTETVKFFINANRQKEIVLGLLETETIPHVNWLYPLEYSVSPHSSQTKLGIFACKGGVGKTTIAVHLALMLNELGYSVALIDEDPEEHLKRIAKSALNNSKLKCYSSKEIADEESLIKHYDYVIHDYPPSLQTNNIYSLAELNYCLIPVNLSPMSMGFGAEILQKTFNYIQQINSQARILVLVNDEMNTYHPISSALKRELQKHIKNHSKAHLLPFSIRNSQHLYYWGKGNSFSGLGKNSAAYQDFLAITDYLLNIFRMHKKSIFN